MIKIALCCSAGMSTSMLVNKMKKAAKDRGIDVEIEAKPMAEFDELINNYDVCLLGPQIKFKLKDFQEQAEKVQKPVDSIDPKAYGLMNGEVVLDQALKLIKG